MPLPDTVLQDGAAIMGMLCGVRANLATSVLRMMPHAKDEYVSIAIHSKETLLQEVQCTIQLLRTFMDEAKECMFAERAMTGLDSRWATGERQQMRDAMSQRRQQLLRTSGDFYRALDALQSKYSAMIRLPVKLTSQEEVMRMLYAYHQASNSSG